MKKAFALKRQVNSLLFYFDGKYHSTRICKCPWFGWDRAWLVQREDGKLYIFLLIIQESLQTDRIIFVCSGKITKTFTTTFFHASRLGRRKLGLSSIKILESIMRHNWSLNGDSIYKKKTKKSIVMVHGHRMYKRDGQLYFIRIKGNWVVHGVCNCYTNE